MSTLAAPRSVPRLTAPRGFDLRRTLDSGQAFRWTWEGGVATGVVERTRFRLVEDDGAVMVLEPPDAAAAARLAAYLWPDDLQLIEGALGRDPELARTLPHTRGIAILRQDPWETLASFVLSSFNTVKKIRLSVRGLCARYGEALPVGGRAFPTPERLAAATPRGLARCSLGYRAPYLRALAREVADGRLEVRSLGALPHDEARARLLRLPGVGEKVADCVLLFGLGHRGAFPVDVWVRRAVERRYFGGRPMRPREIREWARARWGDLAGYAQQHLFEYERRAGGIA